MIPQSTLDDLRRQIASLSGQVSTGVLTPEEAAAPLAELRLRLAVANDLRKAYPNGVTVAQKIRVIEVLSESIKDAARGVAA